MTPAIVVSAHTMALGVVRSLGMMGVPVIVLHYTDQDFADRSRFVSARYRVPHPEHEEQKFVSFLLDLGIRYHGAVLFPVSDDSLIAISRHKEVLESRFRVAAPSWEVTDCIINKHKTHALANECGVGSPKTLVPNTAAEVRSAVKETGLPCIVKPCQSHLYFEHFGCKMFRVESVEEIQRLLTTARAVGVDMMLQEFIPGDDINVVNYNSYAWEGEILAEFTGAHVRNGPPWIGPPRVVVSRKIPEVLEPGRRLIKALGFCGYSCTEFKWDSRDGKYKVLDINGRHNLSTLLAVRCGLNFPWLHYRHLCEGVKPQTSDYREGVYWIDLMRDLGFSMKYCTREHQSRADYIRPYTKQHVFANFDLGDLHPFFTRIGCLVAKASRKFFRVQVTPRPEAGSDVKSRVVPNTLLRGKTV